MGFEVQITDEAFADLDAIVGFIKGEAGIDNCSKVAYFHPQHNRGAQGNAWTMSAGSRV